MDRRFTLLASFAVGLAACGDIGPAADVSPDGQMQAANAALADGRPVEAQRGFELVLESDPGSIEARLGLAESAFQSHDVSTAAQAYEEVLGLGADRTTICKALRGLAALHHEQGDDVKAAALQAQADALSKDTAAR